MAKTYLDAIKDFLNRYPDHKSAFEAYFRLGEYQQEQGNYLAAADAYNKVNGDRTFRTRADFATLQCYFALLDKLEEQQANDKKDSDKPDKQEKKPAEKNGIGIAEKDLRQRTATA